MSLLVVLCRYGRLRMQNYGFIMMFILFLICGVAFPQLTSSAQGLRIFQSLLLLLILEPGVSLGVIIV